MKKKLLKKDIQEIEKAIKRFDLIASGCLPITDNIGGSKCGLCKMYATIEGCPGCPIFEKTKRHKCVSTPYTEIAKNYLFMEFYIKYRYTKHYIHKEKVDLCLKALEDEIEFLISLLPDNHKLRE